jgi:catechol 2,3-dioxygenase-like lactoylglutathione lyase family enzyme
MGLQRFDHVGVIVDDLEAMTAFFLDLGFEREGGTTVEGEWVDNVIGLDGARVELVMVRTPDGQCKLELTKFHAPTDDAGPDASPPHRLGLRHIAFWVDDLDGMLGRLRGRGFDTVGVVQDYQGMFRLC